MILSKKLINRLNIGKKAFILFVFSTLLLPGCSEPGRAIDSELAKQIALDSAGLTADQVNNLAASDSGSGFDVTFDRGNGSYHIGVGSDGKVLSYNYKKTGSDQSAAEKSENNREGETSENPNSFDKETRPATTELPEGSLAKSELISRMASFLGISQYE